MQLSICPNTTDCEPTVEGVIRFIAAAAAAGFDCVSLSVRQVQSFIDDDAQMGRVVDALAAHGVVCRDVLSIRLDDGDDAALAQADLAGRLCARVGAEHVLAIQLSTAPVSVDLIGRCAEALAPSGARIALEFVPESSVNSIADANAIIDVLGVERVRMLIDTWHFGRGPSTWADLEAVPLERIAFVQFDDALAVDGGSFMQETTLRRTWPGEGELELDRFCSTLIDRGWSGLISVEVLSERWRELPIESFAVEAMRTSIPYWRALQG